MTHVLPSTPEGPQVKRAPVAQATSFHSHFTFPVSHSCSLESRPPNKSPAQKSLVLATQMRQPHLAAAGQEIRTFNHSVLPKSPQRVSSAPASGGCSHRAPQAGWLQTAGVCRAARVQKAVRAHCPASSSFKGQLRQPQTACLSMDFSFL